MYIMVMGRKNGFTLVELLIVIALLGVLSLIGLSMYQGSQNRANNGKRKTDLLQLSKALEMYANDYGYPAADAGRIAGCSTTAEACPWGTQWSRIVGDTSAVYMQRLPKDPGNGSYCYEKTAKGYKLFAILEGEDAEKLTSLVSCNNQTIYNYVVRSSNLLLTE
jgi:type II secretion system protein G